MKLLWLAAYWGALVWSAIRPQDYFTWFLEALPALVVFVILLMFAKYSDITWVMC